MMLTSLPTSKFEVLFLLGVDMLSHRPYSRGVGKTWFWYEGACNSPLGSTPGKWWKIRTAPTGATVGRCGADEGHFIQLGSRPIRPYNFLEGSGEILALRHLSGRFLDAEDGLCHTEEIMATRLIPVLVNDPVRGAVVESRRMLRRR